MHFRNCEKLDGMSILKSKKGSCFFDEVLQDKQVTSDCNVPPNIEVTKECDEDFAVDLLEYGDKFCCCCKKSTSPGKRHNNSVKKLNKSHLVF